MNGWVHASHMINLHVHVHTSLQQLTACHIDVGGRLTYSGLVIQVWLRFHIRFQLILLKPNIHPPVLHDTLRGTQCIYSVHVPQGNAMCRCISMNSTRV